MALQANRSASVNRHSTSCERGALLRMQYAHCPATVHFRDRAAAERSAYCGLQALARWRGLVQQSVCGMGVVIDGVGQRRVPRYEVRCVPA